MATKEEILQYIRKLAEQKVITREELIEAYDFGSGIKKDIILKKQLSFAHILSYIGGAIVFLGISILVLQNWSTLGFVTKVLTTLGSGIAAYLVGLIFSRDERTQIFSSAFYLIFALTTPIGLSIIFDKVGFDVSSYDSQSLISFIMFLTFLLSFIFFRKNVFAFFGILFGTWLFFSLTSWMVEDSLLFDDWNFYMYRLLVIGIAYILIGYSFSKNEHAPLSGFLYNFGILGVLGSTLALGGWGPADKSEFWELIYPGIVFGALYLSVQIKSKAFLIWGTIFLIIYILKITLEYFSVGLGWPLALVVIGLTIIGAGYISFSIKNKYF
jgi:hypothetical protein